jgi:hypothetical protein
MKNQIYSSHPWWPMSKSVLPKSMTWATFFRLLSFDISNLQPRLIHPLFQAHFLKKLVSATLEDSYLNPS